MIRNMYVKIIQVFHRLQFNLKTMPMHFTVLFRYIITQLH